MVSSWFDKFFSEAPSRAGLPHMGRAMTDIQERRQVALFGLGNYDCNELHDCNELCD